MWYRHPLELGRVHYQIRRWWAPNGFINFTMEFPNVGRENALPRLGVDLGTAGSSNQLEKPSDVASTLP